MRSNVINARAWPAIVTVLMVVGVGQLGRLRVPEEYRIQQAELYDQVVRESAGAGRRADVVVLGNSRIQVGVNAQLLGNALDLPGSAGKRPEVVNLATPGGVPATSLWLWRNLWRSHRSPAVKMIVVGVAPIDLTAKFPASDYALRYMFRLSDVPWLVGSGEYDKAASVLSYRASPLYAYGTSIRGFIARRPTATLPFARGARWRRGWLPVFAEWYTDYRVDRFQLRCVERLIRDARGRGVSVVLVAPPVEPVLLEMAAGGPAPPEVRGRGALRRTANEERSSAALGAFRSAMAKVAQRDQVRLLDYMTREESTRFAYHDASHLSASGAVRFTTDLARRINGHAAGDGRGRLTGVGSRE